MRGPEGGGYASASCMQYVHDVAPLVSTASVEGRARCHQVAQAPLVPLEGRQVESGVALVVRGLEELCGPPHLLEQALKGRLVAVLRRSEQGGGPARGEDIM